MPTEPPLPLPTLGQRIALAFSAFFTVLGDADAAARVRRAVDGATIAPPAPPTASTPPAQPVAAPRAPVAPPAPVFEAANPAAALQLLGLLQREARLIDFAEEDLAGHPDADIGAAARVVHAGCRRVLREHFTLQAVRTEAEGSRLTLAAGFDAAAVRLTGNVVGQAPYSGTLNHRGWRAAEVKLPKLAAGHDASVVAPAEVEL